MKDLLRSKCVVYQILYSFHFEETVNKPLRVKNKVEVIGYRADSKIIVRRDDDFMEKNPVDSETSSSLSSNGPCSKENNYLIQNFGEWFLFSFELIHISCCRRTLAT